MLENRRAFFDYEILEKFEAGLELTGSEVKSLRSHRGLLTGAHAIIRGGEAYIVGFNIPPYQASNRTEKNEEGRTIRLLLNKKELNFLDGKISHTGLTIIALSVYTKGGRIKVELGLAKGKKKFDKRETIRRREDSRSIARTLKRE